MAADLVQGDPFVIGFASRLSPLAAAAAGAGGNSGRFDARATSSHVAFDEKCAGDHLA
ncbi:hypothetical protein [Bradyrhizobium sp.]|uniref:hypothetical protein n=1 Tax=Bradyrhizobium sp. TaxID=376 RepID=UPI003BB2120B